MVRQAGLDTIWDVPQAGTKNLSTIPTTLRGKHHHLARESDLECSTVAEVNSMPSIRACRHTSFLCIGETQQGQRPRPSVTSFLGPSASLTKSNPGALSKSDPGGDVVFVRTTCEPPKLTKMIVPGGTAVQVKREIPLGWLFAGTFLLGSSLAASGLVVEGTVKRRLNRAKHHQVMPQAPQREVEKEAESDEEEEDDDDEDEDEESDS
mmetsp:Transcript_30088/g.54886  ORF Transcript_30088/g.54886 Transcript_30088/m.54886 type:complete len:208 (+) Transcript_30088:20-643(+)